MSGLILHLSILQSHVFLLNSRLGHFSASRSRGNPFSRSYRVILPSSLAMIHSSTCGYSPRLPVSVYGTGAWYLMLRSFSRKYVPSVLSSLLLDPGTIRTQHPKRIYLPWIYLPPFNLLFRQQATPSLLCLSNRNTSQYWNINQSSIN